jgi:tetratricopeptide (TPR) repeat protein
MVRTVYRVILLALLAWSGVAWAQQPGADAVARARTHFEAGRALYNLGNYTDAIREFSAGYHDVPKPQFLVNLGQCYRKLNDLPKAREMYKKFLAEATPDDPDREQVRQIVADLDAQIAAAPPPPPPEPPPPTATPVQQAAAVTSEAPPRKPWIKRNWWVIPVGAVVVGAALGVGLYYGLQPKGVDCSAASLGCIDTMMR